MTLDEALLIVFVYPMPRTFALEDARRVLTDEAWRMLAKQRTSIFKSAVAVMNKEIAERGMDVPRGTYPTAIAFGATVRSVEL